MDMNGAMIYILTKDLSSNQLVILEGKGLSKFNMYSLPSLSIF